MRLLCNNNKLRWPGALLVSVPAGGRSAWRRASRRQRQSVGEGLSVRGAGEGEGGGGDGGSGLGGGGLGGEGDGGGCIRQSQSQVCHLP